VCVFITAVPITKLFAWREGDRGGHLLRETTLSQSGEQSRDTKVQLSLVQQRKGEMMPVQCHKVRTRTKKENKFHREHIL